MRRYLMLLAALLPLFGALGAHPADARLGGGHSFGSRGSHSYSSPPSTRLAPGAAPFERSQAPVGGNSFGRPAGYGTGASMFGRHPFATGLMGGLIGAGIIGMLFGGGFFHGGLGFGGLFGTIIQLVILFFVLRFLFRLFMNRRGGNQRPGYAAMGGQPPPGGWQGMSGGMGNGMGGSQPLQITPSDQSAFEQCLVYVQQAWGNQDMAAISRAATPEMVTYFNGQLANLTRQNLRNRVADIRVETMELSEAWSEGDTDYATVAMRFSMLDVTEDARGQVVDGSTTTRALVTEIWTFTRRRGGHWSVAAIQQTR